MPSRYVLVIRFKLKPGTYEQFQLFLTEVLDECAKESGLILTVLLTSPSHPDQVVLHEFWEGTRELFQQVQLRKSYRAPFMEKQKLYIERVHAEWSIPVQEW